MSDPFFLGGKQFHSRLILGSGKFSLSLIKEVIEQGGAELITLALRRADSGDRDQILQFIPPNITRIPNTSGARDAGEAIRIAHLARALGCGDFIKVEIMRDSKYLLPENSETIRATEQLAADGFQVLPYIYPDLSVSRALVRAGAAAVMPLAAPIGSNRGLLTRDFVEILINEIELPVIVDAGIGKPSHACEAMELGVAAVMVNTAISSAGDVSAMARAFRLAISAGREAFLAKTGRVLSLGGEASSPLTGFLED